MSRNVKYLVKSYYWEKVTYSKLRCSKFKKFVSRLVLGELQLTQISLNFKISCFFLLLNFEMNYDIFKVKESMLFVEQNRYTLIKTRRNRKWKIPLIHLERWGFTSYKNRELKVKLQGVRAREIKKECISYKAYFVRRIFLTFVLSQCIVP